MCILRSIRPLLITIIFVCTLSVATGQWAFQGCPESGFVHDYAVDDDKTFLLAQGELFYANNSDFYWQRMNLPDTFPGEGLIFASKNRLYLFSDNDFFNPHDPAVLYRTDDMGITWKNITPQFDAWGRGVNIVVHQDSLFISAYGDLLVSFDAGDSYTLITDQPIGYYILYLNQQLYAYSSKRLYKSENFGIQWDLIYEAHDSITDFDAFVVGQALYRIESVSTYPLDMKYSIYISLDGGSSWQFKSTVGPFNVAQPTMMGEEGHLFLIEDKYRSDELYYSTDQGENWQVIYDLPRVSYEYNEGLLFCHDVYEPTISSDYGQTFQKYTSGFRAAMVTDAVPGNVLYANTKEELYLKNASHQWSRIPNSKSIAYLDGHLVGYINNLPRRSADGGITWDPIPASAFGLTELPGLIGEVFGVGNAFIWSNYFSHWYSLDYGITWHSFDFSGGPSTAFSIAHEQGRYIIHSHDFRTFSSSNLVDWINISTDVHQFSVFPEFVACQNEYVIQTIGPYIAWLAPNETEWELFVPQIKGINDDFHSPVFTFMESVGNVLVGGIYGRGVFVSHDLGSSWFPVNEGLDDFHTRSLVVAKDTCYLGVDGGVWTRPVRDILGYKYSGTVFNDINGNGIFDASESGLENVFVCKEAEAITVTSTHDGEFTLFGRISNSDTIQGKAPLYGTITTASHVVTEEMDSIYIGVHLTPGIYDASVNITNTTPFQPGFEEKIIITYKNKGTESSDLVIKYVLNSNLAFISASIAPTLSLDTFMWSINNVSPGKSGTIEVLVEVDPGVSIGSTIKLLSTVTIEMQTDVEPSDNESYLDVIVVGSYDPNDKAVYPSGYITPAMIADTQRLEYTIRFQNTGNYPATFVRIQDTLSTSLDLTSLEILAASHDFTWKLLPYNVLDFFFDNINLPDSTNDERNSHGFVKFAINAKSTLKLADKIENKAYIYFDYNVPVVTNTVGSTVGFATSIKESSKKLKFSASPSPTNDFIMVTISDHVVDGEVILTLYGANGALVKTKTFNIDDNMRIDVRELPSGVYYLQARVGREEGTISILKN